MRNLMKLITITLMTALLLCVVIGCASADDKIYTSPLYRLPADRLVTWAEAQEEEVLPEETDEEDVLQDEEVPGLEDEEVTGDETTEPGNEPGPEPESESEARPESESEARLESESEAEPESESEPEAPERAVLIFSSQGKVVTENEIIYLTSELIGFDDVEVAYQWQVDRGDGLGWVDIEGGTGPKHMFVARRDTITYKWRLIVTVVE